MNIEDGYVDSFDGRECFQVEISSKIAIYHEIIEAAHMYF
jgi:hypothetical protein